MSDEDDDVRCWHTEPGSPCDWDICRQPERLDAGDIGTDPKDTPPTRLLNAQRRTCPCCT